MRTCYINEMNIFVRFLKNNLSFTMLTALMLALATALCCIGFSAWFSVKRQISDISSGYTTVAVPIQTSDAWFRLEMDAEHFPLVNDEREFPYVKYEDTRYLMGAFVKDTKSVVTIEKNKVGSYRLFDMYSNALAVVAAKCVKIENEHSKTNILEPDENGIWESKSIDVESYIAKFSVLEIVALNDSFSDYPMKTVTLDGLYDADCKLPYEEGKTYLLFGAVEGIPYTFDCNENLEAVFVIDEANVSDQCICYDPNDLPERSLLFDVERVEGDAETYFYVNKSERLPFCAEYNSSVQAFLESEEGSIWKDTIIPMCKLNYSSGSVVLTDNVKSILGFCRGNYFILDGRTISEEEYNAGSKVCLVSASWASKNGIKVGDWIDVELYETKTLNISAPKPVQVGENDDDSLTRLVCVKEPLKFENKAALSEKYEVVGIYSAPEFEFGSYEFDANTFFIPNKAYTGTKSNDSLDFNVGLYSIIIENGMQEEFENELDKLGFGGAFAYFDGEYGAAEGALDSAKENSERMFIVGIVSFIVAVALFLFICSHSMNKSVIGARLLGVKSSTVKNEFCKAVSILAVLGVVIGTCCGLILFNSVTAKLISNEIMLPVIPELLCGTVLAAVTVIAVFFMSKKISNSNLMQRK